MNHQDTKVCPARFYGGEATRSRRNAKIRRDYPQISQMTQMARTVGQGPQRPSVTPTSMEGSLRTIHRLRRARPASDYPPIYNPQSKISLKASGNVRRNVPLDVFQIVTSSVFWKVYSKAS